MSEVTNLGMRMTGAFNDLQALVVELQTKCDNAELEAERANAMFLEAIGVSTERWREMVAAEGEAKRLRAALRLHWGEDGSQHTVVAWKGCHLCSALAGTESNDQWIADAESGKDREVPGNYRYKLTGAEAFEEYYGVPKPDALARH